MQRCDSEHRPLGDLVGGVSRDHHTSRGRMHGRALAAVGHRCMAMLERLAGIRIDEIKRDEVCRPGSAWSTRPSDPDEHTAACRHLTKIDAVGTLGRRRGDRNGSSNRCVEEWHAGQCPRGGRGGDRWRSSRGEHANGRLCYRGWGRRRLRNCGGLSCGVMTVGCLVRGCFRRHRAGIQQPLTAVREPPHVAGEGKAARDDAQSGAFGEE